MGVDKLDMVNRDPTELNSHVKVAFEDVLAEPDGAHSIDCCWRCFYRCFSCGMCCYKLLTFLCGTCIALYWGCFFSCVAFEHIWCTTPYLRYCSIEWAACGKCYRAMLDCFIAPVCELCGLFHGRYTIIKG